MDPKKGKSPTEEARDITERAIQGIRESTTFSGKLREMGELALILRDQANGSREQQATIRRLKRDLPAFVAYVSLLEQEVASLQRDNHSLRGQVYALEMITGGIPSEVITQPAPGIILGPSGNPVH